MAPFSRAHVAIILGVGCLTGIASAQQAPAPQEPTFTRVEMPKDLSTFQLYDKVDKPDRKITRYLYINKGALAKVKDGEPFPEGTVLVMEDHPVALDTAEKPILAANGRLQPTGRVRAYSVMEKRKGWGETNLFPPERDNGDWEYASFKPDGSANPIKLDNCYACHLPQTKDGLDFTFSGAKIREAAKR
jgi:hypothetical protein